MGIVKAARAARFGVLFGLLALASCLSANLGDAFGGKGQNAGKPGDEQLTADDLRAYCPRVTLHEGTAVLRTFTRGHDNDPDEIIYQATITDVTRACRYDGGYLYMQIAAAGRVVWGPKGAGGSGNLELPIRVAIKQGDDLPYSNLGKIQVAVQPGGAATQFIYKDEQIAIPAPTRPDLVVLTGFDEGPYNTK